MISYLKKTEGENGAPSEERERIPVKKAPGKRRKKIGTQSLVLKIREESVPFFK